MNTPPIDDPICRICPGLDMDSLPAVDRAILRVSVWGTFWQMCRPVVVGEAVQLAKGCRPTTHGLCQQGAGARSCW